MPLLAAAEPPPPDELPPEVQSTCELQLCVRARSDIGDTGTSVSGRLEPIDRVRANGRNRLTLAGCRRADEGPLTEPSAVTSRNRGGGYRSSCPTPAVRAALVALARTLSGEAAKPR